MTEPMPPEGEYPEWGRICPACLRVSRMADRPCANCGADLDGVKWTKPWRMDEHITWAVHRPDIVGWPSEFVNRGRFPSVLEDSVPSITAVPAPRPKVVA